MTTEGRLGKLPHALIPSPSCKIRSLVSGNQFTDLALLPHLKHAKFLRRSVLQLIQSLHGARSSWGPARVLERWVYAQPWSVSPAMFGSCLRKALKILQTYYDSELVC